MKGVPSILKNLLPGSRARPHTAKPGKKQPASAPQGRLPAGFIEKYSLSPRQIEITEALFLGMSNREIADSLAIEVNTVQVHLQKLYRKTDVRSRSALMALVRN
jgi:DNA-binding NarL/FixJ family response regulator